MRPDCTGSAVVAVVAAAVAVAAVTKGSAFAAVAELIVVETSVAVG